VRWNGDTFDDDQYSQGTLAAKPASDSFFIGVGVRHAAAGTASYYLYYTANTQTFFGKLITGTFTAFGAVMGGRTAGEVLRIEAEGTTIRAKVDGATQRTQTDSSLTTGAAGLTGYDTSTTLRLDDWEAGNVTPDPTPTYVASGAMVVTATNNATMAPQAPASRAAGDILVLVAHTSGNGDFNDTITNWTKLPSGTETNGANQKVECWWRVADGTASDNATVGGVADTNIRGARIFAVRNAANQAPTVARSNNAASATVTFPAADATSTTTLSVLAYCYEDDPTAIGTVSGFSAFDPDTSATGTDMAIGTDAYRANTTSGSKAGGTATVSGGTFANSVNVGLHFIFEPISTTATGTAAITLPALTATGSGTHTAPTYTGSATITLPALTATGTGTASGPTATGSATPSLPVMTATGDGTFTAPVYTGSAALTLPALTASGTGTHPFIGTATPSLPALTAEGTGTHTAPTYTGSAAVSLPALTADGAGTFTVPTYTGTAAVNLPALTADGTGAHTAPVYTGSAAITLPALTASGAGTQTTEYQGDGAATLPALTASGTGTFAAPTYTGNATITLPALTATGDGIFASAVYSGTAAVNLPALTATGTGAHTAPTYTGAGAATLPAVTADSTGTFTAPVYTGTAALTLPVPTATGSGAFTVPTYDGAAAITLPALTVAGVGTASGPLYTASGAVTLPVLVGAGAGTFSETPLTPIPNPGAAWSGGRAATWGAGDIGAWGSDKRGRWGDG
jgi:hypothetical protein